MPSVPQGSAIPWRDTWQVAISDTSQVIVATSWANKGYLGQHVIFQPPVRKRKLGLHLCGAGSPGLGPRPDSTSLSPSILLSLGNPEPWND